MRSRTLLAAVVAVLVPVAGCGGSDEAAKAPNPAKARTGANIASFKFLPADIRVKAGGTVTWTNRDRAPHTATSERAAAPFNTRRLRTGESGRVRFTKPGRYPYLCVFHPFMKGTVEVVE